MGEISFRPVDPPHPATKGEAKRPVATTKVLASGTPTGADVDVSGPVLTIDLELGLGIGEAAYISTDLTYDYVKINAEYTS